MSPLASAAAAFASLPAAALATIAPAAACASLAAAVAPVWMATCRLTAAGKSTTTVCGVGAITPPTATAAPGAAATANYLAAESAAADAVLTAVGLPLAKSNGMAAALPEGV